MKKLILGAALLCAVSLFAKDEPFGKQLGASNLAGLHRQELQTFDHAVLLEADERRERETGYTLNGRVAYQHFDANSAGQWQEVQGGRVWLFRFHTENAKAVGVLFDRFHLPVGSSMFLYTPDLSYITQEYTDKDNNADGYFRTAEVPGDEAILEYFEPNGVVGQPLLSIEGFVHLYRYVYDYEFAAEDAAAERASDPCEVDVRCPEGAPYTDQINGVVRLSIVGSGGVGLCSGSMVNNTNYDCKNYLLTAMHCIEDVVSASQYSQMGVRFRYQKSGCGTGSAPTAYQVSGVNLRADSNDGGGASGSDFALLELQDQPSSTFNVYYNGWDASGNTPSGGGVGIHHPAGDVKKISTAGTIVNGTWSLSGFHWRVSWIETVTNWGVTEGGSSGSPLFNNSKRIIGTLTGGGSYCTSPTASDFYGKVSRHWTSNPNTASQKLKVWLDPGNTGLLTIGGAYKSTNTGCQVVANLNEIEFADFSLYPTLATEQLNIRCENYVNVKGARVFDSMGALVKTFNITGSLTTIEVNDLAAGTYFITFDGVTQTSITKKFVVVR